MRPQAETTLPAIAFGLLGQFVPALGNLKHGFLGDLIPDGLGHGFRFFGLASVFIGPR